MATYRGITFRKKSSVTAPQTQWPKLRLLGWSTVVAQATECRVQSATWLDGQQTAGTVHGAIQAESSNKNGVIDGAQVILFDGFDPLDAVAPYEAL